MLALAVITARKVVTRSAVCELVTTRRLAAAVVVQALVDVLAAFLIFEKVVPREAATLVRPWRVDARLVAASAHRRPSSGDRSS
jgi:hypothetical protein